MLEDNTAEAVEAEATGMHRRNVVKAGANLAWAVPAITLAGAAPALAASGTTATIPQPPAQTTTQAGGTVGVAKIGATTVMNAPITNVMQTVEVSPAPARSGARRPRSEYTVSITKKSAQMWKPLRDGDHKRGVYLLRDGVVRPGDQIPPIKFKVRRRKGGKVVDAQLSYVLTADAKRRGDADPAPVTGTVSF